MTSGGTLDGRPKPGFRFYLKRTVGIIMLLCSIPVVFWLCFALAFGRLVVNSAIDAFREDKLAPAPNAAETEAAVRGILKPVLMEKYGLEDFDVRHLNHGLHIKIKTADGQRQSEIVQDIIEMKRKEPRLPQTAFFVEVDVIFVGLYEKGGFTVLIPDAVRGYEDSVPGFDKFDDPAEKEASR